MIQKMVFLLSPLLKSNRPNAFSYVCLLYLKSGKQSSLSRSYLPRNMSLFKVASSKTTIKLNFLLYWSLQNTFWELIMNGFLTKEESITCFYLQYNTLYSDEEDWWTKISLLKPY